MPTLLVVDDDRSMLHMIDRALKDSSIEVVTAPNVADGLDRARKGVVPLLKPEEARNEYFIEATRDQLRRTFEKSIGKTEYTLTENAKVKILTVSGAENFYYITMDKETPALEVSKIIESVRKAAT